MCQTIQPVCLFYKRFAIIILLPAEEEGSAPVVSRCAEMKIPCIVINSKTSNTDELATAYVTSDDVEAGEMMANFVLTQFADGGGYCHVQGVLGNSAQVQRGEGVHNIMDALDSWTMLAEQAADWDPSKGVQFAEDWLNLYGDEINAIICDDDDTAAASQNAMNAAGRTDIVCIGVNGGATACTMIKAGTMLSTVYQDGAGQITKGIEIAKAIATGQSYEGGTVIVPFAYIKRITLISISNTRTIPKMGRAVIPCPSCRKKGIMQQLRFNWGIIGLGNIAREFCENMQKIGSPYAVAARDISRAEQFAQEFGATKYYGDYAEMLGDPNVDIVYISTVNSQHYENIKACLLAGKHVLCEKCILGDAAQLEELSGIAEKNNLLLAEAMTIFHMPITKMIKELVQQGQLGRVKYISADLGSLKEDNPENRFFNKELGGGSMLDIGTYGLSWVCSFFKGMPQELAHVMTHHRGGADESWSISMKSGDDIIANVNLAFLAKLPKRAIVACEKAYFEIYNYVRAEEAQLVYPDGKRETITAGSTDDALLYEIQNVERAINEKNYSLCEFETTARVVEIIDTLFKKSEKY